MNLIAILGSAVILILAIIVYFLYTRNRDMKFYNKYLKATNQDTLEEMEKKGKL